jgi:hypothetical protein
VRIRKDERRALLGAVRESAAAWACWSSWTSSSACALRCRRTGSGRPQAWLNDIVRVCSARVVRRQGRRSSTASACDRLRVFGRRAANYPRRPRQQIAAAAKELKFEKAAALRDMYLLLVKGIREKARGRKSLHLKREEAQKGLA